jgi:predicted protein tyrosine phosphatase
MSHLVSVVDPAPLFARPAEDQAMPPEFSSAFRHVLRLRFADRLETDRRRPLRRPPGRADALRVISFVERTAPEATGYTVHCWHGFSRSAALALGILFLLRGSEEEAARELMRIRRFAKPHPGLVAQFDAILGSRLADASASMNDERLIAMRAAIREAAARSPGCASNR